jgi:hypothetical protein
LFQNTACKWYPIAASTNEKLLVMLKLQMAGTLFAGYLMNGNCVRLAHELATGCSLSISCIQTGRGSAPAMSRVNVVRMS